MALYKRFARRSGIPPRPSAHRPPRQENGNDSGRCRSVFYQCSVFSVQCSVSGVRCSVANVAARKTLAYVPLCIVHCALCIELPCRLNQPHARCIVPVAMDTVNTACFPICPLLPPPRAQMDYRCLRQNRAEPHSLLAEALAYGHYLWLRGLPARALLALARGLYCDAPAGGPPLPYGPMAWMMRNYDDRSGAFLGNPRLSFQHQALRLRGERRQQRSWRAWGVNALARAALPHLPSDPSIPDPEPDLVTIAQMLNAHGLPGETALLLAAMQE